MFSYKNSCDAQLMREFRIARFVNMESQSCKDMFPSLSMYKDVDVDEEELITCFDDVIQYIGNNMNILNDLQL